MPVKITAPPFNIFNNILGSATFTSSATSILYKDTVGYQVNFTGVSAGTLQINGSNDYNPNLPQSADPFNASQSGTWVTLASTSIGTGTPNPIFFNMNQLGMAWIQCQYIASSGTGTLSGWIVGKSLG